MVDDLGGRSDSVDGVGWDTSAPEGWVAPVPDALDLVIESDAMLSVFAAERYVRIDAMRMEALEDAARYGFELTSVIDRSIRLELASALSITEGVAASLLLRAEALVHRYPRVLDALGGARITERHAELLIIAVDGVAPELRAIVLPQALALAEVLPVGSFRRKLNALVESVQAVTLAKRHERALQSRRVIVETAGEGMGWLHMYAPMVEVHAIYGRVTAQAKILAGNPVEERTLDQLRSDVMCDLLIDGDVATLPSEARGIRASVVVTIPALSLLGTASGVASMEGVGPIPIDRAWELCGGANEWMRVLTHPETGIVVSVGRDRYRPPPELRKLAKWRAETCMAPGCSIPASRCEIDHTIAWEHGGSTALGNLAPLCKGHHTVKHHGRWCVEQIPDSGGALLWTSPTGRRYRVDPERRTPVFVPSIDDDELPPF